VLWLKASAKTSTTEWDGGNRRDQAAPHEGQNYSTNRKEEE
jgi:hypothetical protein